MTDEGAKPPLPGGRAFQPAPASGRRTLQPASFIPLHCSLEDISITVEPGDPPPPTPAMLERWARATESNPRLFNGPILRYLSHSPPSEARHSGPPLSSPSLIPPQLTARHDTYQRYAMQPHGDSTDPNTAIYHLAVTGVLTTRDDAGRESVLLARRGPATFVYPDRWEHAPGGGLENGDIYSQLLLEMEEELGLPGLIDGSRRDALLETPGPADVLGLVLNPSRPSVNIALRVRLRPGAERAIHPASWESTAIQFVRIDALADFLRTVGEDAVVPPTLAIWRGMGWA